MTLHIIAITRRRRVLGRKHSDGISRLIQCRRWKPLGVVLTAVAFLWVETANYIYWVAATRHIPVGSGPPVIETGVLVICALLPWWWIGKGIKGEVATR